MILVDTSVWVDHLRSGNRRLKALLYDGQVLCHPFIFGELACGNLQDREQMLSFLAALPEAQPAEHREVLHLVAAERLYGRGLGWVDAHLLASARLTGCDFWTLDARLQTAAKALKIAGEA